ncbi:MAG: hypothetical protein ACE5GU_09045 [Candidatus Scalinduaceae bacterium]
MPIKDCNDANTKLRQLKWYVDNFWILSFAAGAAVAVIAALLSSTGVGLIAGGIVVAGTAGGLAYIYKKLSDAIRKVEDWIAKNC